LTNNKPTRGKIIERKQSGPNFMEHGVDVTGVLA